MGMWTACFDASGHEDDPRTPFITVAGFLSSSDQWTVFSDLWKERLTRDGVEYFRMAEFAHSVGQFDGWKGKEERRKALLGDLIGLIKSHAFRKFGVTVRCSAMNELSDAVSKEFKLTAYVLAGRSCGGDVRTWATHEDMRQTPFAFVFEEGDPGQGKLRQRFEEDALGTPNFRPKRDTIKNGILHPAFIPLQAADILAYEMSLCAIRQNVTRWAADELLRMPGSMGLFDVEDLKDLEKKLAKFGPVE